MRLDLPTLLIALFLTSAVLAAAVLAGLVLGGAQQVRGAHFMSHTLWTGWLCWTVGWLCDLGALALRPRLAALSLANDPPHAAS